MSLKVKDIPSNGYLIAEEYGYKYYVWLKPDDYFIDRKELAGMITPHPLPGQLYPVIEHSFYDITGKGNHYHDNEARGIVLTEQVQRVVVVDVASKGSKKAVLRAYNVTNAKHIGVDCTDDFSEEE
jgi:hypothetical protein